MKRFILTLLIELLMFTPAMASNIDVLPTMLSRSNVQDRVWVGTFQMVWNDLSNKVLHTPIRFPDETPQILIDLNKKSFNESQISSKCYYKYLGKVNKNTKPTIEKAIQKKFNETSDILDKIDLTPNNKSLFIYAMLKKNFKFKQPFDKLGTSNFRDMSAEFFGINNSSDEALRENVNVLFYNNPNDYAIMLETQDNDEVYLYKTRTTKSFNLIYTDMIKKQNAFLGNVEFSSKDMLKIPNLKFFEEKSFDELTGHRIKGTEMVIDKALETVKFEMNNEGVELKSEAAIKTLLTSAGPGLEIQPRYFYFDDTFVMFLKEKDKRTPYFALRVHNIDKFQ